MDRRAEDDQGVVVAVLAPVDGPEHEGTQEQQEQAAQTVADQDGPTQEQPEPRVHPGPEEAQEEQRRAQHGGQDHAQVVVAQEADDDGVQHQEAAHHEAKDAK